MPTPSADHHHLPTASLLQISLPCLMACWSQPRAGFVACWVCAACGARLKAPPPAAAQCRSEHLAMFHPFAIRSRFDRPCRLIWTSPGCVESRPPAGRLGEFLRRELCFMISSLHVGACSKISTMRAAPVLAAFIAAPPPKFLHAVRSHGGAGKVCIWSCSVGAVGYWLSKKCWRERMGRPQTRRLCYMQVDGFICS